MSDGRLGKQGECSGESTRLSPKWHGFDSRRRRHMWDEFLVGTYPCSKSFSPGTPVFLPPEKPTIMYFLLIPFCREWALSGRNANCRYYIASF